MACPKCGFASPAGFKFCGQCGSPVPEGPESVRPAAERRQITVMFCDLVGSTSLSEKLDPEELRELVQSYQGVCADQIEGHGGTIAQYLGDGVLAYFGYPQAHPDDALRAVRAARGIVARMQARDLAVRVGLHTGMVVVGEMGAGERRENLAMGETPNVAARLQSAAEPNTVVASRATWTLAEDRVEWEDLGVLALKGLSRPFRAYRAVRELQPAEWRSAVRQRRSRLPLVGRQSEQERLLELWQQGARSVGITGGPGVGKTRLVQWLKDHLVGRENYVLSLYCSPEFSTSSFAPVIDLLEREFRLARLSEEERFPRLLEGLARKAPGLDQRTAALLARLLDLKLPAGVSLPNLQPQALRLLTLQALIDLFRRMGSQRPTLFVVEDLFLADPSTREFLRLLSASLDETRILLVAVGDCQDWHNPLGLELKRLTREQSQELVAALTDKPLPGEVVERLIDRCEGIPLFLQECAHLALESSVLVEEEDCWSLTGSLDELGIPVTLQDFLTSHLDRAGPSKELAQKASVVGPYFAAELLERYTGLSRSTLEAHLERLVREEVLLQLELAFAFCHGMLQQAAYGSLLKSVRQECHLKLADTLEAYFPELAESQPEVLAYHYTRGAQLERALECWSRAGQRALQASANQEAIAHFRQALGLLETMPRRYEVELGALVGLASAHIPLRGYAAPEVAENYSRARELCRRMGDGPGLFEVLGGLWVYYLVRAELDQASELSGQLLRLAAGTGDDRLAIVAHAAAGQTSFYLGELESCRKHLEEAVGRYRPEQHRGLAYEYFQSDPAACSLSYLAMALWLQGEGEQAQERAEQALTLARQQNHPHTLAHVLFFDVWLQYHRGDLERARRLVSELAALAGEQAFPFWHGLAVAMEGCFDLLGPDPAAAAARIGQGLQVVSATGAKLGHTWFVGVLAQLQAVGGNPAAGLEVLAGGLAACSQERWWESELYRLQGDLLARSGASTTRVEAAYDRALQVARELGERNLELRAACSLGELWRQAGGHAVARDLVQSVLAGLKDEASPDQQRARELLAG
ncbi:MAG: hypothetical protein AMXMBFR33_59870 [Candidatus Xenobia bacterium]